MGACYKVLAMTYFNYLSDEEVNARFRPNYHNTPFPTYNPRGYTAVPGSGFSGPGYILPGNEAAWSGARIGYESQFGTPRTTASATPMGGMPSYVQGGSQNFYGPQIQAQALAPQRMARRGRR